MRKALIVGAGGTGTNVLIDVANFISARRKENISDLKNLEYYLIDTESANKNRLSLPDSDLNFQHLMVDEYQNDVFKQQRREGKHAWMDSDYCKGLEPIIDGASATRVKGKYAFLQHYDAIREAIITRLQRLRDIGVKQQEKTQIYVVANAVSGTGSGCFVDLGIMIRDIIKKERFSINNASLRVTLIITLPTVYTNERQMGNANFALQELNHYMMGNPYEIDHVNGRSIISFEGGRIFDYVYFIGKSDVTDTNKAPLENLISEYIYNDIFSSSADIRDKERDNLKLVRGQGRGQKPLYMSFGLSVIEYPSSNILEAASCKYIEETLDAWFKTSDKNISSKYASNYFEEEIFNEMLVQCQSLEGVTLSYETKFEATKKLKMNNFYDKGNEVKHLKGLKSTFDTGFDFNESVSTKTNPQYIGNGDFEQILTTNVKRLIIELPQSIKEEVLGHLFSGNVNNNIDYAKKTVTKIIAKLQTLRKKVARDLSKHTKSLAASVKKIDDMKGVVTFPLVGIKSTLIKKFANSYEASFQKYADDKLYNETLRKMNERFQIGDVTTDLLSTLEDQLTIFLDNISELEISVKDWQTKVKQKFEVVTKPPVVNGHVVKKDKISELSSFAVKGYGNSENKRSVLITNFLREKYYEVLMSGEKQNLSYTNESVFFSVKGLHQKFMKPENVIDVFLSELRVEYNVASDDSSLKFAYKKVQEVNNKSNPSLEVESRDDAFVVDKNLENKLSWVFYPDGKVVKTPEIASSGTNPFAKILKEAYIIEDGRWDEKSQSSNDTENGKDMIIFLKEVGVFPIRFLKILRQPEMINALRIADKAATTRCDRKGRYLPIIPPSKQEYEDIKTYLLKSIALETIKPIAGEQKFVINETVIGRGLSRDENEFELSTRYDIAIPELSDDADTREILIIVFNEIWRDTVSDSTKFGKFIKNLEMLKGNAQKLGLIVKTDDVKEIDLLIYNEILKDTELKKKWNKMYPNSQIIESTLHKAEIIQKGGAFYCNAKDETKKEGVCGHWLGYLSDRDTVKGMTECPNCGGKLRMGDENES